MTARDNKGRFCKVSSEHYREKLKDSIKFILDCTKNEKTGNFGESIIPMLKLSSNGEVTYPLDKETYLDLETLYSILK